MPKPVLPSPSQSPAIGFQAPPWPQEKTVSAVPGVLLLRRYQLFVAGSNAPIVVVPLPSQSPTTGNSVPWPQTKRASGTPPELELRRYHVCVVGSNMPMVVLPVPVQSPTTGIQPYAPQPK